METMKQWFLFKPEGELPASSIQGHTTSPPGPLPVCDGQSGDATTWSDGEASAG